MINKDLLDSLIKRTDLEWRKEAEGQPPKTILVVAFNYQTFKDWQRKTKNKNAKYLGRPKDCREYAPENAELIKIGSWWINSIYDSFEFIDLFRRFA